MICLSVSLLTVALPQGLIIGLGLGFEYIKIKINIEEGIKIRTGSNCNTMSNIEYICYDKEK